MQISELKQVVQSRLASFLWEQWAQLGVSAATSRHDSWAADPEALLLLSLEVGREEPRLLDEVLDWLALNERMVSVQRLRNLAVDDQDRALLGSALGWTAQWRNRAGPELKGPPQVEREEPLFRHSSLAISEPDPAFLAQGLLKPLSEPRRHSRAPDLQAPIGFAFRLRALLGVSARAEVVRVLLTIQSPWMNVQALAASTAYTKRNVQEALNWLSAAGMIGSWRVGNENRFDVPHERWAALLEVDQFPSYREWPHLFGVFRLILRWLVEREERELSDYMLSSEARTLAEDIDSHLRFAGMAIDSGVASPADDFWPRFSEEVMALLPA